MDLEVRSTIPQFGARRRYLRVPSKAGQHPVTRHEVAITLHFADDSVALSALARAQLTGLERLIQVDRLTKVAITGYASSTGSVAGNERLGIRRAVSAEQYIVALLARLHVKGVHLSVAGKGASSFAVKNPKSGLNRRDVIQAS